MHMTNLVFAELSSALQGIQHWNLRLVGSAFGMTARADEDVRHSESALGMTSSERKGIKVLGAFCPGKGRVPLLIENQHVNL